MNSDEKNDHIDGLSLKIHSLERSPTKALLAIFKSTDDITLLNLASVHPRFEPIAQDVFRERYANKYFVIEGESKRQQEVYSAQLSLFGSSIMAIEVKGIQHIDGDHWMTQLLHKNIPNLEKLCFTKCSFRNADELLLLNVNLTHLTFRGGYSENGDKLRLPEYRNLIAIELTKFRDISKSSLEQILRNNPQLESLILKFCNHYFTLPEIMEIVCGHLKCLKELNVLDSYDFGNITPPFSLMNQFVSSLESLESFGLTICQDFVKDLLARMSSNCKQIKSLELFPYGGFLDSQIIQEICSFEKVETLSLLGCEYQEKLESIIEGLQHLRVLSISMISQRTTAELLSIIRKCKQLETLIIESKHSSGAHPKAEGEDIFDYKLNTHFHDEFIQTIRSPCTKIEFHSPYESGIMGLVTKDEIIWRNKLLHWVGHDPIHNHSNVHLLDLANIPKESIGKQPLNLVFNYLDLNSLYAFCGASKQCKQLVHDYIDQRCKEQTTKFIITDEFGINHNALHMFGQSVTNLDVYWLGLYTDELQSHIEKYFKNLTIFRFRTRHSIDPHNISVPQVRHFLFYGSCDECVYYCHLSSLSQAYPNLEIFETRTPVGLHSTDSKEPNSFRNLQQFKFKPTENSDVEFAKEYFRNTDTEVIIDHS